MRGKHMGDREEEKPLKVTTLSARDPRKPRYLLREIWSLHLAVGRFSVFIGIGEVSRT